MVCYNQGMTKPEVEAEEGLATDLALALGAIFEAE